MLAQCGCQRARLRSLQVGSQSRQDGRGLSLPDPTDLRVHRPARTALLNNCSRAIQSHVADLGFSGFRAVKNFSIHNETAANATAKCDVEDGIAPLPRAAPRLTQS